MQNSELSDSLMIYSMAYLHGTGRLFVSGAIKVFPRAQLKFENRVI